MNGIAKLLSDGKTSTFLVYHAKLVLSITVVSMLLFWVSGHPKIPNILAIRLLDLFYISLYVPFKMIEVRGACNNDVLG